MMFPIDRADRDRYARPASGSDPSRRLTMAIPITYDTIGVLTVTLLRIGGVRNRFVHLKSVTVATTNLRRIPNGYGRPRQRAR